MITKIVMMVIIGLLGLSNMSINNELIDTQLQVIKLTDELNNKERDIVSVEIVELSNYEYAERIYGVDAALLEAIERWETGHFKSQLYINQNNSFGARYNGEWLSYDSTDQSTLELARTLKFKYINQGLNSLEEISKVYCPDDSEAWVQGVSSIYEELKGK